MGEPTVTWRSVKLVRRGQLVIRESARFEGMLQVTDASRIEVALERGIGRSHAFGLGCSACSTPIEFPHCSYEPMKQYVSLRLEGALTANLNWRPARLTRRGAHRRTPRSDPPIPLPRMSVTVEDGNVTLVPYFPGSGIRGKLRRMAEEVVRFGLVGEDGVSPFSVDDAYYLRNGGVKGARRRIRSTSWRPTPAGGVIL